MSEFDAAYASEVEKKRQDAERALAVKLRGGDLLRELHAVLDEADRPRRDGFLFDMTNDGRLAVAKHTSVLGHWRVEGGELWFQETGADESSFIADSVEGAARAMAKFVAQFR